MNFNFISNEQVRSTVVKKWGLILKTKKNKKKEGGGMGSYMSCSVYELSV